jgi:uncharacterized protein YbbC (DUF1343 family)
MFIVFRAMKIMNSVRIPYTLIVIITLSFSSQSFSQGKKIKILQEDDIRFGADLFLEDSLIWKNKKIALVVNQTSVLSSGQHLVDAIHTKNAKLAWIYAPEHGFRGKADRGARVKDGIDERTSLQIKSLYGAQKKPAVEDLKQLDLIVFDIQDVGTRFYTYLSTMYYLMQAASEAGIPLIILDRPNPNGFYVDGPVLDTSFRSFVGILPVPIVHGMTLGELAHFIIGEELIENASQLQLKVYPCEGYTHHSTYNLPVKPSPNLPNLRSILLYPSLCYFEASNCSVGRGTERQFQVIGSPHLQGQYEFTFTPVSMPGASQPKFEGQTCNGLNLSTLPIYSLLNTQEIQWHYLFTIAQEMGYEKFMEREDFMNLLMGTDNWKPYLKTGAKTIWRDSYQKELEVFKSKRLEYLLYPE